VVDAVLPVVTGTVLTQVCVAVLHVWFAPRLQQPTCGVAQSASGVQPVPGEVHTPVASAQYSPVPHWPTPVHGPQVPDTQAWPAVQSAALAQPGVPVTHSPALQVSPTRHWALEVHWPQWPGLPGMHTGAAVPWQSRSLWQPATHAPA